MIVVVTFRVSDKIYDGHLQTSFLCKYGFVDLSRAKYTTSGNDIQPPSIVADSSGKQFTGIYLGPLVGG